MTATCSVAAPHPTANLPRPTTKPLDSLPFMVFAAAIATLLLYFIRPQDWIPVIEGANVVRPVIALGLIGLFMRRRGSRSSGPLPFFKTPHEWLMLVYLGYIVFTSPDSFNDAKEALSQGAFFFITLHAIQSSRQLQLFLRWWCWALLGIVVMALGTVYGFDFTSSASYTEAMFGVSACAAGC